MSKQRRNGVARSLGGDIFITVVLIVVAAFMMLPFVYAIMQSLKPIEEIFIFPPRFFVVNPTLSNYLTLSKLTDSLVGAVFPLSCQQRRCNHCRHGI